MIRHSMNHQSNFYQLLLKECYDRGPWGGPGGQTCVRKMPHIHRTGTWEVPCHSSPPHEIPYASEQHKGMKTVDCIRHRSRASYDCSCDLRAGSMCWTSLGRRDTWTRHKTDRLFLPPRNHIYHTKFNYTKIRNHIINWQRAQEGNIRHIAQCTSQIWSSILIVVKVLLETAALRNQNTLRYSN